MNWGKGQCFRQSNTSQFSYNYTVINISENGHKFPAAIQRTTTAENYSVPSPLCLPFSRSPDNALMLTSADTEQVASSQWLSTQPSNRKQVSPDTPAPVLNVATGRTRGFVLTVSGDISSGRGRPSPSFGLGVSVSSVSACLRCRLGRGEAVRCIREVSQQSRQEH